MLSLKIGPRMKPRGTPRWSFVHTDSHLPKNKEVCFDILGRVHLHRFDFVERNWLLSITH